MPAIHGRLVLLVAAHIETDFHETSTYLQVSMDTPCRGGRMIPDTAATFPIAGFGRG
jgi:hypothetical protein